MLIQRIVVSAVLPVLVSALAACGNPDVKKPPSQVAARVNGDEISVHQVNRAVARGRNLSPEEAKQAAARALERSIDEELLAQQALKAKLDREPQVMREIERAKRLILAQAYMRQATFGNSTNSPDEIRQFYSQNPALFAERRIYWLQELTAVVSQEKIAALETEAAKARKLKEIARWLESQNIGFNVAVSTKAAEQVPLSMLGRLIKMKDGQITVFVAPDGVSVIQVVQSQAAAVTEEQATPVIEHYLANRKRLQLAAAEVKKLREQATIEYVGEFETARAATPARPDPSSASHPVKTEQHIERGVSGL